MLELALFYLVGRCWMFVASGPQFRALADRSAAHFLFSSLPAVTRSLTFSHSTHHRAPAAARLPLVVVIAGIGLGLGGLLVAGPAQAQSRATPTRLAPLMIDPALLGGAPVAPASATSPAALGGLGSGAKTVGKKTKAVGSGSREMAPTAPATTSEPAASAVNEPSTGRTVTARSQPESAANPAANPANEPTPAPQPSAPSEPAAPRVPTTPAAPTEPVPARAQTTESTITPRDRKDEPLAANDVATPVDPQPMPQALPREQTELLADAITGRNDLELTATGNAELRRDGAILNADRMVYNIVEDSVDAQGNVLYRDPRQGTTMTGSEASMVVAARTGYIDNVNYEIRQQKRVTQPNQGPWTFNAPPVGNQPGSTAQQVASSPNAVPSYGVAASATMTQQPGVSSIAAPATAETVPVDSPNANITGVEGHVQLPGQTPLAKVIETVSHGQASRIYLEGEGRYKAEDATYTTCPAGDSGWYLRASTYHADYEQNSGNVSNSLLYFQNVPFFYTPYAFFPLDKNRHSGFLAPSFGSSKLNGFQAAIPYYFNLAPNYDATVTPMIYGKRGTSLNTDLRYLGNEGKTFAPTFNGRDAFNYLPNDRLLNRDRWSYLSQHQQNFGSVVPGLTGAWDLQGVSDSYYFTDLNSSLAAMSQSYLPRTGRVNYAAPSWNASVVAQGYQTLNFNPSAQVATPYQMLPQVNFAMNRSLLGAAGFSNVRLNDQDELEVIQSTGMFDQPARLDGIMTANSTYFTNPGCPTTTTSSGCPQPFVSGNRLWAYPQFATSWQSPGVYITPKVGVHYTQYNTNAGLGTNSGAGYTPMDSMTTSRTLPIMSLDTGMVFDRKTNYFGRNLNQTLEPRLYYLYVPYRNQTNLPLFDTGQADVSYAQMFSENIFTGWDRISNANQVTAAVSSRYSLEKTGQQLMGFSLGQRIFFQPQQVNLYSYNTANSSYGSNDYFAQANGMVAPYTSITGYAQVSPYPQYNASSNNPTKVNRINRASIGARFQPSRENVLNYTYRYQNQDYIPGAATSGMNSSAVMQNDINGAWKIWGPWRAVGRYTYSAVQSTQIESLAGLEYDAACWALRAVYHRAMTYSSTQMPFLNTSVFVQLELKGMGSVGSSPLQVLRRNIPNYSRVSDAAFMAPLSDPYY